MTTRLSNAAALHAQQAGAKAGEMAARPQLSLKSLQPKDVQSLYDQGVGLAARHRTSNVDENATHLAGIFASAVSQQPNWRMLILAAMRHAYNDPAFSQRVQAVGGANIDSLPQLRDAAQFDPSAYVDAVVANAKTFNVFMAHMCHHKHAPVTLA